MPFFVQHLILKAFLALFFSISDILSIVIRYKLLSKIKDNFVHLNCLVFIGKLYFGQFLVRPATVQRLKPSPAFTLECPKKSTNVTLSDSWVIFLEVAQFWSVLSFILFVQKTLSILSVKLSCTLSGHEQYFRNFLGK